MTALTFTPTTDWAASNRYTATIDTYVLLSNAGEPAISWTLTDSDLIPVITPRQANVLARGSAFQLMIPAGQRLWLSKRGIDAHLEAVVNIERGVPGPIPPVLLTDNLGPNQRIRVDVAQTGFFAGREFRTIVGGTPSGVFSETLPVFATNNMLEKPQPPYVAQNALTAGGAHDGGGTVLDVLRGKTADNSNFAASVGFGQGAERGIATGTYYFLLDFTVFIGVLKARWEERL